jgi:hypothetical protein
VTSLRLMCPFSIVSLFWTPLFCVRMKASIRGACPIDPARHSGCLGVVDLTPSWGQHASAALPDNLHLCSAVWVSLHVDYSIPRSGFLLFFWIIKLAMLPALITEDYSTRASSTPSYFLRRFDLLRNLVSDRFVLDLTTPGILQTGQLLSWVLFSFFLDRRAHYSTCRWL